MLKLSEITGMEESAKKSLVLKNEFDPEFAKKLEVQLTKTYNKINELQKQMETAKSSDTDSVNGVSFESNEAKGLLEKLVKEKKSLQPRVSGRKRRLAHLATKRTVKV